MKIAPLPSNELERLAELRKYSILDSEPEEAFDGMVKLASYICQTPFAAISLVDEHRQWFKAICGVDAKETSRDVAFCAHTILQAEPLVVPNALEDERFCDNPLVAGGLDIRFYAGVPLVSIAGFRLGTLCVIDQKPRQLTVEQMDAIQTLATSVMAHLELRLSHQQIRRYVGELQLSAAIFESATEAMLVTDATNRIVTVNPAFVTTTGYTLEEVVGRSPSLLKSGKQDAEFYQQMWRELNTLGHWSGELWNKRKNGALYAEWLTINVLFNEDGSKRQHVAVFSDITEKKLAEERNWRHANFDHLTKLPSRRLFRDRLEHDIKMAHRTHRALGLLYIDLDWFKQVNDTLGHDAGDQLLQEAAIRLSDSVRESDTVARMGGDEFTAILPQIEVLEDVDRVAAEIIHALARPFILNGISVTISASVGIALYPADAMGADELLKKADQAMYSVKNSGRGRYHLASEGI